MIAVCKHELRGYFHSLTAYVFGAFLLAVVGVGAMLYNLQAAVSNFEYVLSFSSLVFVVIVPILTMRVLAEERRQKTDQLLLTSPLNLSGLVAGKFLAAFLMYCIALAVTVAYSLILAAFAVPEWPVVIGNILGALLLGAALISIGVFISSLTENQLIAAVGSFAVMMFILMIDGFASLIPVTQIASIITSLSFMSRYNDFVTGILNISNILFFISVAVVFNFFTVRVLEKRRWG